MRVRRQPGKYVGCMMKTIDHWQSLAADNTALMLLSLEHKSKHKDRGTINIVSINYALESWRVHQRNLLLFTYLFISRQQTALFYSIIQLNTKNPPQIPKWLPAGFTIYLNEGCHFPLLCLYSMYVLVRHLHSSIFLSENGPQSFAIANQMSAIRTPEIWWLKKEKVNCQIICNS